jgi:hypothetical protein
MGEAPRGTELVAADLLEGGRVLDADGKLVGVLEDVMIDLVRGEVAYGIVALDGEEERLLPVPWIALHRDAGRECFIVEADRAKLEDAPTFPRARWPSMSDAAWAREVHRHFGAPPGD